ncbi:MAG: putative Ig domain-containing protein, partial [Planctomycetota bacterium]
MRTSSLSLATVLCVACGGDGPTITDQVTPDVAAVIPDNGNQAPVLYKVGDRVAEVGKPLEIALRADDADVRWLGFSAHSLPDGAAFTKDPPSFRWTPTVVGQVVSPTFVVTDGTEVDRETVRIEVVSESQNHPPRFQRIGDQAVEIGATLSLILQAVDPDGDTLTFGLDGTPPAGAAMDAGTGVFTWTPAAGTEGSSPKVTFTVSDGAATDDLPVTIYVLAPGQNRPPTFTPLPPQTAFIGTPYVVNIGATDPEGDGLTFGFEGELPEGGAFEPTAARFTWNAPGSAAGTTGTFLFSVTDGHYTILGELDVDVVDPSSQPTGCQDDVNEPNNTSGTATALTVGVYDKLSLCDTTTTPVDADWFAIALTQGQSLALTLDFDNDQGDLDMALYRVSDLTKAIALAAGADDQEVLSFAATKAEELRIHVFGSGQAVYKTPYSLTVSTGGLDCEDDSKEPNDTILQPYEIAPSGVEQGLQFCPGDLDYFSLPLACGETLTAELQYTPASGPLDIYVYREGHLDAPVVVSALVGSTEAVTYEAPRAEDVVLLVRGAPPETTLNAYSLSTSVSGGSTCGDDVEEPNDTRQSGTALTTPSDEKSDLVLCCDEDWFFFPLVVGDGVLVEIQFEVAGGVSAELYTINDPEPLAV